MFPVMQPSRSRYILLMYEGGSACHLENVTLMTGKVACAVPLFGAQPASQVIKTKCFSDDDSSLIMCLWIQLME